MKVVLFCGGQGMRLREFSEHIPKPMVNIGYRPILWHLMKYYAHYGHKDFILCLGYRADVIKNYFLKYEESLSNDFVLSEGGSKLQLLSTDVQDWKITFVDTGARANIGERLMAVKDHLQGEEMFLANYSDGLTDCPLPEMIESIDQQGKIATFMSACPQQSFHVVSAGEDNLVNAIQVIQDANLRINAGFFVMRQEIFDYMRKGEELVVEPFRRLIEKRQLATYPYDGFWMPMDTFKDKQALDEHYASGNAPWQVWK